MKTRVFTQFQSFQRQETVISLDSVNIAQPCVLSISATQGTQLTGQITLNGRVVKEFKGNQVEINISPLLSKGRQKLKILGHYQPALSPVKVKILSFGTQTTQQTSGNGILNKSLIIDVQ